MEDIARSVRLCEKSSTSYSEWIIDLTGGQAMLHLTCSMIPSVDPARYGKFRAKDMDIREMCYNGY